MTRTERKLFDLLERERLALLQGDYASLAAITKSKTALLDSVDQKSTTLPQISKKVNRNQRLTALAKSAIDSAIQRLNAARNNQHSFSSYARDGSRQVIASEAKTKLNSSI